MLVKGKTASDVPSGCSGTGADLEAMKQMLADVAGVKIELEREVRVVFNPGTVLATATGSLTQPGR